MDWTAELRGVTPRPHDNPPSEPLGGVLHLAALVRHSRKDAAEVYRVNIEGTLRAVRLAASSGCRAILASSSGVVGCFQSPDLAADEDAPYAFEEIQRWPYYHSKAVAERRARELAPELRTELIVVRPPILLGPGDHRFRSTANIVRFLRGRLPFLIEGGMHFADVRDVAKGIVAALEHPSPRPVYHFTGTICTLHQFFALAGEFADRSAPRLTVPTRAAWWVTKALRPLDVLPDPVVVEMATHYWATTSRYAEPDLGYASRDPRDSMRETVEWLRANHPALKEKLS
jgi:dihydroflavonol-4-reductase